MLSYATKLEHGSDAASWEQHQKIPLSSTLKPMYLHLPIGLAWKFDWLQKETIHYLTNGTEKVSTVISVLSPPSFLSPPFFGKQKKISPPSLFTSPPATLIDATGF